MDLREDKGKTGRRFKEAIIMIMLAAGELHEEGGLSGPAKSGSN